MRFLIVDDDPGVRAMLRAIIEDEKLGEVVGEEADGIYLTPERLNRDQIDILLIDLLMPERDGIETMKALYPSFNGKAVMISQVETKDMIAEAYLRQVEQYITKPINLFEVISVLTKVANHIRLESSIQEIQKSLKMLGLQENLDTKSNANFQTSPSERMLRAGEIILSELGIRGECGSDDLLIILQYLNKKTAEIDLYYSFPPLKEIWQHVAKTHLEHSLKTKKDFEQKEMKATEQRVRRTIQHALIYVASLGTLDHTNPKFEDYATKFFDLSQVHQKMQEMNHEKEASIQQRINIKKFMRAFYYEAKENLN